MDNRDIDDRDDGDLAFDGELPDIRNDHSIFPPESTESVRAFNRFFSNARDQH
jgi:hypothetical protein